MKTRILGLAFMVLLMTGSVGCKSVHWSKADTTGLWVKKNKKKQEAEVSVPERMVIAWKDSVYEDQGVPMTRGFGGRIYFYNAESEPTRVDGELVVYGFDDSRETRSPQADYKFVFTREELAAQFSENALGPSYSIWLPWDNVGGEEKHVSLIPVFKDASGKIVRGDQTVNALHGKKSEGEVAANGQATPRTGLPKGLTKIDLNSKMLDADVSTHSVAGRNSSVDGNAQVGYHEATVNTPRIRSTTIAVPSDTAQRMANSPAPPTPNRLEVPQANPALPGLNPTAANLVPREVPPQTTAESAPAKSIDRGLPNFRWSMPAKQ